ncbi:MAG: hypothetical protein V4736_06995, partial [Bdellovibrionota bacterium]
MSDKIKHRFKKTAKWILIGFGSLIGILVTLVVGIILWVYFNPMSAWQMAEKNILPKDLKIVWEQAKID